MTVIGNFENAKKVMEECENSQLVVETRKQHLKLSPKFIGNFREGVHQQLSSLISHPDKVLDGFPLAYNNVRVLQKIGKMISDQTCVHFDVEADFIMFKPAVGCRLNGKVNKIAKRHVGCLVHDHFNAWFPHTSSTEKISADRLMGTEIEFTVQDIATNRNLLSIKGKFEKFLSPHLLKNSIVTIHPIEKKRKTPKKKKDADITLTPNSISDENIGEIEENVNVTLKKKKKHKKSVTELSQDSVVDPQKEIDTNTSVNGEVDEERDVTVKKRHKKDKRKSREVNETVVTGSEHVNDSIASVTSCEPLFTSTQVDDVNNNKKDRKHKKKKKHERIEDMNESYVDSVNSVDDDGIVSRNGTGIELSVEKTEHIPAKHKMGKSRKRQLEVNSFTMLKDNVHNDSDLAVPSPVKKSKKHKKLVVEMEMDSSADFEESSKLRKKEKKMKHKQKSV